MIKQRLELTWYNKDKALLPTENGKYGYTWVEPSDPRYCETHTLMFDEYVEGFQSPKLDENEYSERADLEPQSDNLLIHGESGDVLEALTRVPELAGKYVGQVKLIYLDPPFNTSKTFESYEDNLEHSIWLTMMRDRLINLKKLLSKSGSIWVHLDRSEVHRMRVLMDEVFGSNNFISQIAWEKTFKPRNDAEFISGRHDIILVYKSHGPFTINRLGRTESMNSGYSNPDDDVNGRWTSAPATATGSRTHQGMVYAIQHPITGEYIYPSDGQHWRFGQDNLLEIMKGWNPNYQLEDINDVEKRAELCNVSIEEIRKGVLALIIPDFDPEIGLSVYEKGNWPMVYITSNGYGGFRKKTYLSEMEDRTVEDMWFQKEVGSNDEAKSEIKKLFPGTTPFSTPKPERLLERIIHIASNPGDIVLDSFAGSGTSAAVAQKMGRKWITCELLETNFNTFTKPRLEMVVKNQDPGGITHREERTLKDNAILPDGFTTDELFRSTQLLNKLSREEDLTEDQRQAIGEIKRMIATGPSKAINWRGGGGFQVAHISPSCFDYDSELDRVILTEQATGQVLIESVAANFGYRLLDRNQNSLFDAKKGRSYLKVYEGIADTDLVDSLVAALGEDKSLVLATTGLVDGVREYLRKIRKGSRIIHLPDGIFRYSKEGRDE